MVLKMVKVVMKVMQIPVDDFLQPGIDVGCPLGPLGSVAADTLGDDGLDIPGGEGNEDILEDSSTVEVEDTEEGQVFVSLPVHLHYKILSNEEV